MRWWCSVVFLLIGPRGEPRHPIDLAEQTTDELVPIFPGAELVDICDQRSDGCHLFFSFEPKQGLNSINLNTGIDGPAYIRVGRQIGTCGMSLLWSGYSGTL